MTDWDLLTPGIGLTSIGITGVGLSLSGIAKTFVDGMHAVTLLTMFIGMIFLASGLFKDGFPSSGRAKSATFITLGFLVTFGVAAAVTVSTQVPTIFAYIGLMAIIGIPSAVLAVVSFRKPQYVKAMGVIFIAGAVVGGITFYAFGLVTPKPPQPPQEQSKAATNATSSAGPGSSSAPPANIVKASILPGASAKGNPSYGPDPVVVAKGDGVEWTNKDNTLHTVTSKADSGKTFDSKILNAGKTYLLNTANIAVGTYEYYCQVHPFMEGTLKINAPGSSSAAGSSNSTSANAHPAASGAANATTTSTGKPSESAAVTNSSSSTTSNTNTTKSSASSTAGATVSAVSIVAGASTPTNGQFFSPPEVNTKVGSMITWTNNDNTIHTVTSGKVVDNKPTPDNVFDSKFLKPGASFPYVFEKTGEFDYYCQLHPYMTGKVTVS